MRITQEIEHLTDYINEISIHCIPDALFDRLKELVRIREARKLIAGRLRLHFGVHIGHALEYGNWEDIDAQLGLI